MEDLYSELEVNSRAKTNDIKVAYQRLALQYHPDKGCADGGERFVRINAAWKVLGDEAARVDYDKRFACKAASSFSERVAASEFEPSDEAGVLRKQCRCGDYYELLQAEMAAEKEVVVQCGGCSLYVTGYLETVSVQAASEERGVFSTFSSIPETRRLVAVTGGSGWLAQHTVASLISRRDIRVLSTFRESGTLPAARLEGVEYAKLDFTSKRECEGFFDTFKPDVLLHLGAMTNVSASQQNPIQAELTNNPQHLITSIGIQCPSCLFVYCSTDLVYQGIPTETPYKPSFPDLLQPAMNSYGKSKQLGEAFALSQLGTRCIVLRLSNMIGRGGGKFFDFLSKNLSANEVIGLREDERRSFVALDDVAGVLCALATGSLDPTSRALAGGGGDRGTVFNLGGPRGLSRLELAGILASAANKEMKVYDSEEEAGKGKVSEHCGRLGPSWHVYRLTGSTPVPSPLDVTMDSHSLLHALGDSNKHLRPRAMEEVIPTLLL